MKKALEAAFIAYIYSQLPIAAQLMLLITSTTVGIWYLISHHKKKERALYKMDYPDLFLLDRK